MAGVIGANLIKDIGINVALGNLDLLAKTVSNIAILTTNISLASKSSPEITNINDFLYEIDLRETVEVIKLKIEELNYSDKSPKSISHCIELILDILSKIDEELGSIDMKTKYNNSLYSSWVLPSWRQYEFSKHKQTLQIYKKKLDNRMKLLKFTITTKNNLVDTETIKSVEENEHLSML
jgi:hypothetical protein